MALPPRNKKGRHSQYSMRKLSRISNPPPVRRTPLSNPMNYFVILLCDSHGHKYISRRSTTAKTSSRPFLPLSNWKGRDSVGSKTGNIARIAPSISWKQEKWSNLFPRQSLLNPLDFLFFSGSRELVAFQEWPLFIWTIVVSFILPNGSNSPRFWFIFRREEENSSLLVFKFNGNPVTRYQFLVDHILINY